MARTAAGAEAYGAVGLHLGLLPLLVMPEAKITETPGEIAVPIPTPPTPNPIPRQATLSEVAAVDIAPPTPKLSIPELEIRPDPRPSARPTAEPRSTTPRGTTGTPELGKTAVVARSEAIGQQPATDAGLNNDAGESRAAPGTTESGGFRTVSCRQCAEPSWPQAALDAGLEGKSTINMMFDWKFDRGGQSGSLSRGTQPSPDGYGITN
ncbi:hypothetical protein [Rubidibacter lacunae]|uniref:hypothetical protein n=1 Tax=Rubidibacter lacunae TaxID=582514 RepID=UPI0012EB369F|nr:hypothetical protein [Rubidibacter lacunae]